MTAQLLQEGTHIHSAGGAFGVSQGERLGLYDVMSRGSVTVFGLAREAQLPVTFVYRWLETQARDGFIHHDPIDGRYSLWCNWTGALLCGQEGLGGAS